MSTLQTEFARFVFPLLAQAASLYRDDFLAGFTLQDSPDFDDWQLFQAERLRQELAGALAQLAQGYTGKDEFKTALTYAKRWLSLDPLHEPAHCCLIQLYAQTGDRTAALRQYQACVRLLQTELGLSPSPETVQLYETIKTTQGSKGAEEQESNSESGESLQREKIQNRKSKIENRNNLPAPLTPLLGRQAELRELSHLLAEPDLRLISLVGPGGIGKTHLALEVARQQLERFSDGVYFVSLAPLEVPEAMIATVAKAFNFSFYEGTSPQQQLCDYLRQKRLLLVLDNFEHLLAPPSSIPVGETEEGLTGGAALVVAWLQAAPALKILVTSRSKLKIQGEQLYPLEGIDFPLSEESPQEISQYSAVQLFLQAAHRLRPDFQLTGGEAPAVAQICRLMQGMPLGILLAAAWIDLFKPTEIASQISQSLDFLVSDWQDLPPRQQSLRAVFDHSWRLLTEREQTIFQQISVFRGGFNDEAAQAVIGASLPELRALVNKSLLRRTESGRYEIHELLRQYGAEKLAEPTADVSETSAISAVHDRHSAYYCAFLQAREAHLKGAQQQLALAEIQAEHDNIRLAWHWAVEQEQVELLAQAMDTLGFFHEWQGYFQEGKTVYQLAAEKLATPISADRLLILTKVLVWQALFCLRLGYIEVANRLFEESLSHLNSPLLADRDTLSEKAFVLSEMGKYLAYTTRQEARQLLEQSLTLYQSLEDRWAVAHVLDALGGIAWHLSSYEEAKRRFQESLAIHQEVGDQRGIARALNMLGNVIRHQGRVEECEQLQRESLALFERMGDQPNIAQICLDLGTSLSWLGRFSEAILSLQESVAIYNDLGYRRNLAWANNQLSEAELGLGRYEQARTHILTALTLFREIGDSPGVAFCLEIEAQLALVEEAYAEAQQSLQEDIAVLRRLRHPAGLGFALAVLGGVLSGTGNFQQAQQYLLEPLRIALETKGALVIYVTFAFVALFLARQGQPERAVELYTLASHFPYVANSRWFEDVTGRHIIAVAANLPPEVVAAAQARGRTREVWATAAELLAELEKPTVHLG